MQHCFKDRRHIVCWSKYLFPVFVLCAALTKHNLSHVLTHLYELSVYCWLWCWQYLKVQRGKGKQVCWGISMKTTTCMMGDERNQTQQQEMTVTLSSLQGFFLFIDPKRKTNLWRHFGRISIFLSIIKH